MAMDSFEELREWLGGEPVLNKLGLILKTRNGKTNARMTLDAKQSKVKEATVKGQRVILPRLLDAVLRQLNQLRKPGPYKTGFAVLRFNISVLANPPTT